MVQHLTPPAEAIDEPGKQDNNADGLGGPFYG